MHTKIKSILDLAVVNKASDVHLSVSMVPQMRVNGELTEISTFQSDGLPQMEEIIFSIISNEQKEKLMVKREIDFSLSTNEARFRGNMYFQRNELACSLRVVPMVVPTFKELNLPDIFLNFVDYKQGFVLFTGPTGHGKSTTVASIINQINTTQKRHIVTIEDPIEYLIPPVNSIISQREVGGDTNSFNQALVSVLRQDPNVVFLGEMRDLETISSALTIAETGHLVFSTLHTNSAPQTVDRIIDVFPEGIKEQIRVQLANMVTAIISQRLIPSVMGGRVPAFEILLATPAVRNAIREGKSFMLDNIIQTSADVGMVGLETSLAQLVHKGLVAEDVAMSYSLRPSEFQSSLRSYKSM